MNRISANKPYFPEPIRRIIADEIAEILAGGRLTQGPWVSRFEQAFAEYTGAKFAIATNSGTSALEILLRFFDVRDCEVIVPTNTFLASGNAVIFAGGKPVLADISADTLCLDPEDLKRKISPKTKGVILVHIAGLITPQVSEIRDLCRTRGLFLLEDAAHAPGAAIDQKFAGNLADGAAFSFYPTKPMTTGEGGM
ncbi:MAG: aminotransferase class I/II-fold pyridoxal phosphate-dependent enzyme, partial [Calditrichaeota bacterium]|nr:aminotransferase class I/II-fold pyridoxal phosphate-dependent enzyme [Calditrichota bacterium]